MAYASAVVLTPVEIARTGISASDPLTAPTETHGNKFVDNGRTLLRVLNGSVGEITVTVYVERLVDGLVVPDLEVVVAATADEDGLDDQMIGPFTSNFHQTDGYVWVTFSAVADVTVAVYRT